MVMVDARVVTVVQTITQVRAFVARHGAADARVPTTIPASVLALGAQGWRKAQFPLERGFAQEEGARCPAAEPDDVYYQPYNRKSQVELATQRYLAKTVPLAEQFAHEDDLRFASAG